MLTYKKRRLLMLPLLILVIFRSGSFANVNWLQNQELEPSNLRPQIVAEGICGPAVMDTNALRGD